jgi:hypothetical protein
MASLDPADDGPVWMVNLMKYRERAEYSDGRKTNFTGAEADDLYAPLEILAELGAEVAFFGTVQSQIVGESPQWDRVGVVKYPTRASFIAMQTRPDFMAKHHHKEAGMEFTIIVGSTPPPTTTTLGELPSWTEVEFPAVRPDFPVVVLHLSSTPLQVFRPEDVNARVALRHGLRPGGTWPVEGTIIGDDRRWSEVRWDAYPSRAAFDAVAYDPERLAAVATSEPSEGRDEYVLVVRPFIDTITKSLHKN